MTASQKSQVIVLSVLWLQRRTFRPKLQLFLGFARLSSSKREGVWVVLDGDCKSCYHGKAWALNAKEKFEKLGCYPKWVHRQRETCSGIGGQAGSETT
eukprot:3633015-Pyramimonas_sp.AAC.1